MSFESAIPRLVSKRLERLEQAEFSLTRVAAAGGWAERRKRWCAMAKRKPEEWAEQLYASVDGFKLRQAGGVSASTRWLMDPMVHIPPSD